ncbi:hypothetical protein EYF80_016673 [Liparis tanakae]|uniref:Uncharacterized protein n=1 Tax=Liparis tanakae TaxID=230148 RepID=A0A4Z2I592_9TELE|nr:hypothetical protein EYF80_016673 [Liparis tanakae]
MAALKKASLPIRNAKEISPEEMRQRFENRCRSSYTSWKGNHGGAGVFTLLSASHREGDTVRETVFSARRRDP